MKTAAIAAGAALAAWLLLRRVPDLTGSGEPEAEQDGGNTWGQLTGAWDDMTATPTDPDTAARNEAAFLWMIRTAEGTAGPNGYRTLFGGSLFESFADHPRVAKQFRDGAGRTLWTTAAGAYQFMAASPIPTGGSTRVDTWGTVKARLGLPDFSPESQDAAALELIREKGALGDVRAGRFDQAVGKVRSVWASMPGAGYSQPEKSLSALQAVYLKAGGSFA